MTIDWWTLGLQAANVLVLIWLLQRFFFAPVAAIIEARRQAAQEQLLAVEKTRAETEAQRDQARKAMADIAASRNDALKAAAAEAEKVKTSILTEARQEAETLRAAARSEIDRLGKTARSDYAREASRLAVEIVAKLLDRLPDDARINGFINGLIEGLMALPEDARAAIGGTDGPVQLVSSRALSPEELAHCRARIADALGRPVEFTQVVDEALIAGLELKTPYLRVQNSFRSDLDRILAELNAHAED